MRDDTEYVRGRRGHGAPPNGHGGFAAPATEARQRAGLRTSVLIASAFVLGVPAAYVIGRAALGVDQFVEGALWIDTDRAGTSTDETRPGRTDGDAWVALLRSDAVLQPVIRDMGGPEDLADRLHTILDSEGNFLRVRLEGAGVENPGALLDAVMTRYVDLAFELERSSLDEQVRIQGELLALAERELAAAEQALEEHRRDAGAATSAASPSVSAGPVAPSTRGIEDALRLDVRAAEVRFEEARRGWETAKLASESAMPDIRILDRASEERGPR